MFSSSAVRKFHQDQGRIGNTQKRKAKDTWLGLRLTIEFCCQILLNINDKSAEYYISISQKRIWTFLHCSNLKSPCSRSQFHKVSLNLLTLRSLLRVPGPLQHSVLSIIACIVSNHGKASLSYLFLFFIYLSSITFFIDLFLFN